MDNERYEREDREGRLKLIAEKFEEEGERVPRFMNYRLIQNFEVPDWVKDTVRDPPEDDFNEYGLGKRKRGEVTYKDALSDKQWVRIIEAGGDPQQESERLRVKAATASVAYGEAGSEAAPFDDEDDDDDCEDDADVASADEFEVGSSKRRK